MPTAKPGQRSSPHGSPGVGLQHVVLICRLRSGSVLAQLQREAVSLKTEGHRGGDVLRISNSQGQHKARIHSGLALAGCPGRLSAQNGLCHLDAHQRLPQKTLAPGASRVR